MLHTEGLRHHVNICQHFYKWCDCHCWLHWSFHRNIRKILFSHPTVWVKLKQGVSLRRLRTPPPSNGPMKPFGRQQCLEWNYVWGEPKGHCCLGQTDISAGKSCYWRAFPFHKGLGNKDKGIVLPWKAGAGGTGWEQYWKKGTQAWSTRLGKAVSLRCCLPQSWWALSLGPHRGQLGFGGFFKPGVRIQESALWSLVAQGLVNST